MKATPTSEQLNAALSTERQYRRLIATWPEAITMTALDGKIVAASPRTARLHGYGSVAEVLEVSSALDLVAPEDRGRATEDARRAIETGTVCNSEHMLQRRDGVRFPAEVNISSVQDADGAPVALIGTARDITERKRLIAVTRALSSKVIAAHEEERFRISRELHDEIGQMLTVVKKQGEWIAAHAQESLIQQEAERLAERTTEMLQLVRNMAYNLRPAVLDDLGIGCALETLAEEIARAAQIGCHVDCADAKAISAEAATALYRIAQEALSNVVRHAEARNFWVTLRQQDAVVQLSISDDGRGISRKREDAGTLGIAGMRERAAMLGGVVEIGDRVGGGTMIKVSIPSRR